MWRVVLPLLLIFSFVHGQKQWDQCSAQMRSDAVLGVTCSVTNVNHVIAPASIAPGYPLPSSLGCTWLISSVYGITFKSFQISSPGYMRIWDAFAPNGSPDYTRSGSSIPSNITSTSGYFYIQYVPGSSIDGWEICAVAPCNATLCDACANGPSLTFAPVGTTLGNCSTGSSSSGTQCSPQCPTGTTGSLVSQCNDGVWLGPSGTCRSSCTQDPITYFSASASYTLGTCSSSGGVHGYVCYLQCTAGGYASAQCSNGAWFLGSCGRDCTTAPLLPNGYSGSCSATPYHSGQDCLVSCAGNYTAYNGPGFTCYDGSWSLNSGECRAPCSSLHPSVVGKFTYYSFNAYAGNGSAFDGNLATNYQSAFDGDNLDVYSCGEQVVDTVHFFVPTGANLSHFLDGEFWGSSSSNPSQLFMVIKQLPSYGWNALAVASTLSGPYSTISFIANTTSRPIVAELEYLRTNPTVQQGSCGVPTLSGGSCSLVCAVGTVTSGNLQTSCTDGVWTDICGSCDAYEWDIGNWTACGGGVCGSVERPWEGVGTQTRSVTCVRKTDRRPASSTYCAGTTQPDNSQVCNRTCPAIPRILSVTPYSGGVEISFNYSLYVDPTNVTTFDYVRAIIFVSNPENLAISAPVTALTTVGGVSTWYFPGLNNGQRYSFTAYAYTWAGSQSLPSQESSSVLPQELFPCYYSCQNTAPCIMGQCHCFPGYYTYNTSRILKGDPRCDVAPTLSFDPFPVGTIFPIGGSVDVIYRTNISTGDDAKLYLYPAGCASQQFCVRLYVDTNIAQNTGVPNTETVYFSSIYPQLRTDTSYVFRLWLSPKDHVDSASFTPTDPACAGITCQNGGTCYNGVCQCPAAYVGSTFCEVRRSACAIAGVICSPWGTCNENTATCTCQFGYSGDLCQYPPGCSLRCQHNGTLWADPSAPSGIGCDRCDCINLWSGTDCSTCSLDCQNGGSPDSTCTVCVCPSWWTGQHCEYAYVTATFSLDLSLTANGINFNTDPTSEYYVGQFIEEDIQWALNPPSNYLYIVVDEVVPSGSRTKVTVQFVNRYQPSPGYTGDVRLAQRAALGMQIMDPASPFRITVTGQFVDETSYQTQDPPNQPAGALSIVPSIFTLCLALLAAVVGRV